MTDNAALSANLPAGSAARGDKGTVENREFAAFYAAIDDAAVQLHDAGYSWTEIARELGVSRQAARQRWGVAS